MKKYLIEWRGFSGRMILTGEETVTANSQAEAVTWFSLTYPGARIVLIKESK